MSSIRINQSLSRRGLLGAGAGAAAAFTLGGCGTEKAAPATSSVEDLSDQEKVLTVANWALYIDQDRKGPELYPTIAQFEEESGITVTYNDEIGGNEEFFSKIRPYLQQGEGVERDIIIMTDWMVSRLIRMGYLQELNKENIPNSANIIPSLQSPSFDPERAYSIPWQSGFTSVAYNADVIDAPISSITEMLTRPDLAGRVAVFTEMRDTMGLVMLDQGADLATFTDADFDAALALLQDAVDRNHIRQFADANYGQSFTKGDLAATMAYSGDINQLRYDNPALELVIPESGFVLWADNMLIPVGATHQANAEAWMDFYLRPDVAAEVAAWVNFITPVAGAREEMEKIDPEMAANELIFPSEETLAKGQIFRALSEEEEVRYNEAYLALQGI